MIKPFDYKTREESALFTYEETDIPIKTDMEPENN